MEDRKRPATHNHDDAAAPPLKRHASSVNGASKAERDAEMPWKDDLERFQKDAIYRQMQEYKRERNNLESRLAEMVKRATYHDDHLRVVDAWWRQLLDEVKILIGQIGDVGAGRTNGDACTLPSALLTSSNDLFQEHLQSEAQRIKTTLSQIFTQLPMSSNPEVAELQKRVSALLATDKTHRTELDRVRAERDQLEERVETASLRYMMAEKKLDRAKSAAVAKLERQALVGGGNEAGSGISGGGDNAIKKEAGDGVNGAATHTEASCQAEIGRREALAVTEKQKEQLGKLEMENEDLVGQVTKLTVKLSNLTDDDYARSDLFKHLKSQYEDVIKRVNGLEATNVQLREEAEKLHAERTAYRAQMEAEVQRPVRDLEAQLARAETDLARIRTARDELGAAAAITKAKHDQEGASHQQIKELASAREERIKALESEVERLRIQAGQAPSDTTPRPDIDGLSVEDLRVRYANLEQEHTLLSNELPSMGAAWKKASALASKKVLDTAAVEEKVVRLQAEKAKADQKYFATMKLKEAREAEVRSSKAQNAKSAEIIAQLKDVDKSTRSLITNLERQLAETKEALRSLTTQNTTLQQQVTRGTITTEGLKGQNVELSNALKERDAATSQASKARRVAETKAEQQRARLELAEKRVRDLQLQAAGNQSEEFEMLRTLALCNVCKARFKNTALKLCGHLFCKECIEERVGSRSRKCPHCSKAFGIGDVMTVHL
ncbi:MAG: E3 ubiquitin-protein ligase bre1 [Thelocarpon superellum]|nr:MAG: E3 ubiquitin-protein ligase bre1 [Thelocarpon superellum]